MSASIEDIKAWQRTVGASPDGKPGRETFARTVEWFRAHGWIKPPELPIEARARVVAIARGELGEQDPAKYYRDAAPQYLGTRPNEKAWCGVFALWCLRQAGLTDAKWIDRKGFVYPLGLPIVQLPEPGDVAYFSRNQHFAIVERCANGLVYTIDGNAMPAPREGVVAKHCAITDVTAFYSIRKLV